MTCAHQRLLTALAFLCLILRADPALGETADDPMAGARRELRQVIFASSEIVGGSVFLGSGFKRALAGSVDAQGPILMSLSGAGATGEPFEGPAGIRFVQPRLSQSSALLFGYQWMGDLGVLMLAAGPEIAREQKLDDFGMPRWRPQSRGVGFIAEVWTEPWSRTMAQATFVASGARGSVWGRVAAGYAPFARVFVGPEISAYRDGGYQEMRIGLHMTGLEIGPFTIRLNGGIVRAPGRRNESYFGFQTYFKI